MQKGNTLFYHRHIIQNIKAFDQRKDNYVYHRTQFLKQYYQPIKARINNVQKSIQHYKELLNHQQQIIQSQPDISKLKQQITQYKKTNTFFQEHVDAYEQKVLELRDKNQAIKMELQRARNIISFRTQGECLQLSKNIQEEKIEESIDVSQKLPMFPLIKKSFQQRMVDKMRKNVSKSISDVNVSASINVPQQTHQNTTKQCIQQFDETQSLFRECFEKKKQSIQKSVSQLQSKLIMNKDLFLKACQVIGQKDGKISEEQFIQMTGDQIITLFISFGWLNRKLNYQFQQKRKRIIEYLRKVNKYP